MTDKEVTPEVPRLSPSIAKLLLDKSPLHAWDAHRLLGGNGSGKSTESLKLGAVADLKLTGEEPKPSGKKKRAAPKRDAKAAAIAKATDDWLISSRLYSGFTSQRRLEWQSKSSGYVADCSGYLDRDYFDMFLEFKTGNDLSDHNIVKQIELYHYDMQVAAYREATGKPGMLLFTESASPYDVRLVTLTDRMLKAGLEKWHKAVRIWSQCMAENHWPGRGSLIADISSYRLKQEPGFIDAAETE